ncbi:hypothetical protein [Pontibacter burrus]|uniref:Uncharacterized protein n=1 Tax=Pontibacter burrus TaxID=2704466 RepID=A0A6B3LRF5_9BACT|nr:hypothetical protein [Pontibacter burrus]NEM96147.1 hypothetical protein [Pontibacter burrus]
MEANRNGWIYAILIIALAFCVVFTFGCKTMQVEQKPFVMELKDSIDFDPARLTLLNGWQAQRVDDKTVVWFPPAVNNQKIKVKGSHNAKTVAKDKSKTKDVGNTDTKARGKGIIGNDNAPIEAKRQAVVGDGNKVEQNSSLPWWVWLLLGAGLVAGGIAWWHKKFG